VGGQGTNDNLGKGDDTIGARGLRLAPDEPAVDLGTGRKAMKLALGAQRTCALLDDQTVKCWGYNAYGALGYGDAADRGAVPGQLGDALPAVDFGPGQTVLGLAASWYDNCVQLTTGTKCWGLNQFGQLGLGDTIDRGARLGQMGDSLSYVDLP